MERQTQLALRAEAWSGGVPDRTALGAVYTPPALASWVAEELSKHIPTDGRIWDIACGEGALLEAMARVRPDVRLFGVDVDAVAVHRASANLEATLAVVDDALAPVGGSDPISGLAEVLGADPPQGVILNPPWGASLRLRRGAYAGLGYELAFGQFDTYDLFVELALAVLADGGAAAFILPDSLLAPEHMATRRLLLGHTLHLVARLGEGFFPAVYRGTLVVVLSKSPPSDSHHVRCLRLTKRDRQKVLRGEATLGALAPQVTHSSPQGWFQRNPQLRIDIDVRENERLHLERFELVQPMVWRDWFESGRGVEISKRGLVVRCPTCDEAAPAPRKDRLLRCGRCSGLFASAAVRREPIIALIGEAPQGWAPLIAGEDVRRHVATAARAIKLGVSGIEYKRPDVFVGPKLLVRKTGVGLNFAVDRTNSYTTQVVYHYRPLAEEKQWLLDYAAAVANSRFILAHHLRTRGDSEWRSHPYVTQRVIEEIPIPSPQRVSGPLVEKLANAATRRSGEESPQRIHEIEVEIERLVAQIYGFTASDWRWALSVINEAQALVGLRELRLDPDIAIL